MSVRKRLAGAVLFLSSVEGEYKLKIMDAREVRYEQTGDASGDPFHQNCKEVLVRVYAPGKLPLVTEGDRSGVNLLVEIKAAKPQ